MKKRKSLRAVLSLAVVVAMLCAMSVSVFAADASSIDRSQTGSITVSLSGETNGTLSLYKVGEISDDMSYKLTDDFAGSNVSLNDLNTRNSEIAASLSAWAVANNIQSVGSAEINASGTAKFSDLEVGLYLIVQTGSSTGYTNINPFVVTVPRDYDNEWLYEVDAFPKVEAGTAIVEPTPTPSVTPEPSTTPGATETPEPSELGAEPNDDEEKGDTEDTEDTGGTDETEPGDETDETGDTEGTEPDGEAKPDDSTTPVPSTGASASPSASEETLPQTGQLNWPIPVLASIGVVLIIVGGAALAVEKKNAK